MLNEGQELEDKSVGFKNLNKLCKFHRSIHQNSYNITSAPTLLIIVLHVRIKDEFDLPKDCAYLFLTILLYSVLLQTYLS